MCAQANMIRVLVDHHHFVIEVLTADYVPTQILAEVFKNARYDAIACAPVTIRPDVSTISVDGKILPLSSGMATTVEIRTGCQRRSKIRPFAGVIVGHGRPAHETCGRA
jgi:hypothetical protein